MKSREIADKMINTVAVMAITSFLIGAMVAIWVGIIIGLKMMLSAVVVFVGDYAVFEWSEVKKKKRQRENRRRKQT